MKQGKRQRAHSWGKNAEKMACMLLRLKGYEILTERLKTSFGEIDIVAKRGDTIAIIEVKARPNLRECIEAVSPMQQQRIARAASSMLAFPGTLAPFLNGMQTNLRFDVIAIRPWRLPHHLKDAWRT